MGALNSVPVAVIALTLVFLIIIVMFINVLYYHLKEKDTKNTMSIYWEKILFWVNAIAIVFGLTIGLYFIVRLMLAISKSRAATAMVAATAIIGTSASSPSIPIVQNYNDQMQMLSKSIIDKCGKVIKIHQSNAQDSASSKATHDQAVEVLKDVTLLIKNFNSKSPSEKAIVIEDLQKLDKESTALLASIQSMKVSKSRKV